MAKSTAKTVQDYLAELPEERRAEISAVRDVVLAALPPGFVETMNWGMISYEVPLALSGKTYNGQPLGVAALAANKNEFSLHLPSVYMDPAQEAALRTGFAAAGKKLDIGKGCVRFKRAEALALPAIKQVLSAFTPEQVAANYAAVHKAKKGN